MCEPYWSQWDKTELDDWQRKLEEEEEEIDCEEEPVEPHNCGNCMDCLGMSWRDFF